ncbi:hypothetical protein AAYQ05_02540 [Flavobacterium sp. B11]|uniref:hypothetical protein n=1 Tax=Flavobacterium movens TaxID=214860 RepID=UPI0031D6B800
MKKNRIIIKLGIFVFFTNFLFSQSNQYPANGDVTIRSYSPRLILQRDTDEGGFISGIETKLKDGTDNWYFGALHTNSWIVSKGDYKSPKLTVSSNGNVGIGTTSPQNKLDVNGTIHSQEVKVDMDNWSDFVFKKEYNLPTLEEVEKHIVENGHLENIPNENEVLQNGIKLGEMNAKLLQKIEEMTLYIIEQNKKIIELNRRLEKVESK